MTINGWDIAAAGARQHNVSPGFHALSNSSDWVRGSPVPALLRNELGFKPLTVVLMIKADSDRQRILRQCSEILTHLLDPAEIILDDFEHKFYGTLSKYSFEENPLGVPFVKYNRAAKLTLDFSGYEYMDDVPPVTGTGIVVVQNKGNILTPATVTVTPQIGAASVVLNGICRDPYTLEDLPVTLKNLKTGEPVVLDGETYLFTQAGKLAPENIDIWAPPTLLPGENRITINNGRMEIAVGFRPRFM